METSMNPLWKHQQEGFDKAKNATEFAFLFEVGTGKTRTTIEVLRYKYNLHHGVLRTIILGPPIVLENWRDEILKYSKIDKKNITVLSGSGKKRAELVRRFGFQDGKPVPHIFITNYEGLLMPDLFPLLKLWQPEIVVADELHKLKNRTAKRAKLATTLGDNSLYRFGLTGTAVLNSPMDLFGQWRFLDKGSSFGKNFFAFRATYFYDKNSGMPSHCHFPNWEIIPSSYDKIAEILSRTSMHAAKKDCLDLPPFIKKTYYCEMGPEQAKAYAQMKATFIAFVKEEKVVAELAITKALRMQQIVSGFAKTDSGEEIQFDKNPRADILEELLEEITSNKSKVIVWAVFKNNYLTIRSVCEKLKLKYVELTGDTSTAERNESVREFNDLSNDTLVCVAHPGAGGVGVNLTSASYSIYFSRNFNLEYDLQSEGRNYRGGSEVHEKITRIDLVTKGTIDEMVLEALSNKVNVGKKLIEVAKKGEL